MNAVKRTLRSKAFWLVVVCLVVMLSVVRATQDDSSLDPLSPDSNQSDGTRALMLILNKLDTKTNVTTQISNDVDTALLLHDDLTDDQRNDVEKWVRGGGTLVLADSSSSLSSGDLAQQTIQPRRLAPACESPYGAGVATISPESTGFYDVYDTPLSGGSVGCYRTPTGFFLVAVRQGLGTVVQLGGPDIFTNGQLNKDDNAIFATNLLAGKQGSTLLVLQPDLTAAPEGDRTLSDFISDGVKQSFWQLALALVVLALWQGRRLGKPVDETPVVEIPGSALVVALGDLLQRAGQQNEAARILRRDLHRQLCLLLGVQANTSPEVLAALVAERTGINQGRLFRALIDAPVANGEALLQLAQQIESLHREVAHAR